MLAMYGPLVMQEGSDYLDGKLLLHGTKVNVRWPNGTSSTHTVEYHVVERNLGEAILAPFLSLDVRGHKTRIPLRDTDLYLVRSDG